MSPSLGATASTSRSAIRQLDETLRNIPGVDAVSSTAGGLPMTGDDELPFWLDGQPKPANESEMSQSLFYLASPDYLKAMEIPLHRGRFFTADDNEQSPAVMVIDESFARQFFPNEDPIGKRIHIGIADIVPEIVGIVGHVKHWGLDTDGDAKHPIVAQAYMPFVQIPDKFWTGPPQTEVVLRTKGSPGALVPAIRQAVEKLNGENVIYQTKSLDEIVADSLAARRFSMILLSVFAALALLLSSIGIYGVISYVVGQRTHEIGIRMALGAQRSDVLRLMLGEGMRMALVGVAMGVAVALGLTHIMVKMLFGVSATDPVTFASVAIVLSAVALAACYIPARRAMRVDPIVALRYE
jgi:predicted permease